MKNLSLNYGGRLLLFLALAATGTTLVVGGSNSIPVWADVIEGTEGDDLIVGTPLNDIIDSKGGNDQNYGDAVGDFDLPADGSGDDIINSGEGSDFNTGDTFYGDGSGNDIINSGGGLNALNLGDTFIGDGSGDDVIISGEGFDDNGGDVGLAGDGSGDDINHDMAKT